MTSEELLALHQIIMNEQEPIGNRAWAVCTLDAALGISPEETLTAPEETVRKYVEDVNTYPGLIEEALGALRVAEKI